VSDSTVKLLRKSPVFQLFGPAGLRFSQLMHKMLRPQLYACSTSLRRNQSMNWAGPHIYSYRDLLRLISYHVGSRRALVPRAVCNLKALPFLADSLPGPPITRKPGRIYENGQLVQNWERLDIEPQGRAPPIGYDDRGDAAVAIFVRLIRAQHQHYRRFRVRARLAVVQRYGTYSGPGLLESLPSRAMN
jgi:hypothetical protein